MSVPRSLHNREPGRRTTVPVGGGGSAHAPASDVMTVPPPEGRGFGLAIRRSRQRMGISLNELARRAAIDPAYVHRMEAEANTGHPTVPRRPVVLAITRALRLTRAEADDLLAVAGYCPQTLTELGGWDTTVAEVADVLTDETVTGESKEAFREVIRLLSLHWREKAVERDDDEDAGVLPVTGQ